MRRVLLEADRGQASGDQQVRVLLPVLSWPGSPAVRDEEREVIWTLLIGTLLVAGVAVAWYINMDAK